MGRPERRLDAQTGPLAEFALGLRRLRQQAGRPSYRALASKANFSATVLSDAAGGGKLPTLAVTRAYVRACGGDADEWEQRWREVSAQCAPGAGAEPVRASAERAPYLGLASYQPADADLFFGRTECVEGLVERLTKERFLAVVGASGCGKSSLLRAGLLPAVGRQNASDAETWLTVLLTPGAQPVTVLAARLASLAGTSAGSVRDELLAEPGRMDALVEQALAGEPAGTELLVVVDQFEELFTLCGDERQRACFVQALLGAVTVAGARTRVVLGVRADFYAQCAGWPLLVAAFQDAQVLVGPLGADELREVIVRPAETSGLSVERALVTALVADAGSEPGALPLVSHALLETWRRCPTGRLTLAAYQAVGGVRHAIATTAEAIYDDCDAGRQRLVRQIFLRLIALGDGGPDTRRHVAAGELASAGADPDLLTALVERLVRARLLTVDDGIVQLAHEAVITSWPRLAGWLAADRAGLRAYRRLTDAATAWETFGREPAALFRGTPLAVARDWVEHDADRVGLTRLERDFLDASSAAQEAEQAAAARVSRRLRALVAGLAVLVLAVTGAGGVVVKQRQVAVAEQQQSLSGQYAAQSAALAPTHPDAALVAALAAWKAAPTVAARSALANATVCCAWQPTSLIGEDRVIQQVAFSPDSTLLASGGEDQLLHLWNPLTGRQIAALRGHTAAIRAIAFNHHGTMLATGSLDNTIILWDPATRTARKVLTGDTGPVQGLDFSPNDRLLASASYDGQVRLRDAATGAVEQVLTSQGQQCWAVRFSPDGNTVAVGGTDDTVTLWDITNLAHPRVRNVLNGLQATVVNVAYSPDGQLIAAAGADGEVVVWDLRNHTQLALRGLSDLTRGLAFSRDGTTLLTSGSYHRLLLWDTATGRQLADFTSRIADDVYGLAYSADGTWLALGGLKGYLQVWRRPVPPFTGHTGYVEAVAVSPDGRTVLSGATDDTLRVWTGDGRLKATMPAPNHVNTVAISSDGTLAASTGGNQDVSVWTLPDVTLRQRLRAPAPLTDRAIFTDAAFSPAGHLLAASAGGTVVVWDITHATPLPTIRPHDSMINAIAFSRDGRALAVVTGRAVTLWNATTGRLIAQAPDHQRSANAVAFSPDGHLLATGGDDRTIVIRDAADLRPLHTLPAHAAAIQALAFAPDGTALASAGNDGTAIVWNTHDWSAAANLTGDSTTISAIAFTPDSTTLIAATYDRRLIAWNLGPRAAAESACRQLSQDPELAAAQALVPGTSYQQLCPART